MNAPSTPAEVSTFEDGDLYDLVLGDLDYAVDFYVGLARAAQGPVLDICADIPALKQMVGRFGTLLGQELMYFEVSDAVVEFILPGANGKGSNE